MAFTLVSEPYDPLPHKPTPHICTCSPIVFLRVVNVPPLLHTFLYLVLLLLVHPRLLYFSACRGDILRKGDRECGWIARIPRRFARGRTCCTSCRSHRGDFDASCIATRSGKQLCFRSHGATVYLQVRVSSTVADLLDNAQDY